MKKLIPSEFVYQLFALLIAVIVVHGAYVGVIRPNADAIMEQQQARVEAGEDFMPSRSLYVILRDYEQEACFILMLWAIAVMAMKGRQVMLAKAQLDRRLIDNGDGPITLEQAGQYMKALQQLPKEEQEYLPARTALAALRRFDATRNVQHVAMSVREVCDTEAERLESELSMIRYIAWAIPSIGFIGTVRGIGEALGQAHEAVQGDIAGVTASLGVAFNSTFTALVISILIMFLLHQLQLQQERLVLDSQGYCENNVLHFLQINGLDASGQDANNAER